MDTIDVDPRDLAAERDVYEGIRQGLEDLANGRTRPARGVFDEMRRKFGIPSLQLTSGCQPEQDPV